jgi:hypothetical protein
LNNFTKDVYVVDKKTNELIEHRGMKRGELLDIVGHKDILTDAQKKRLNSISDIGAHSEKLGGFIFLGYVKNKLLFNELDIEQSNITRLIYLSTYLNYNTSNENLLIRYTKNKEIVPLDKKHMKSILKLQDRTFYSFIKNMKDNNLLFEVKDKFYLSPEYFTKGAVEFNSKEYTRIYIKTTRLLYENATSRQHKQLSYIYQLIPFIHFESNILTFTPDELDVNNIKKMQLIEICELLKIDRSNMLRFKKELLKFYIDMDDNRYYFFKYVRVEGDKNITDYFVVNPAIIWKGHNIEIVKKMMTLCFFDN